MPSPTLTRRALLAGAGTALASAAIGVPYVNAAYSNEVCSQPLEAESVTSRIDRLTYELAQAMGEYQGGKFKVVVEPGMDGDVQLVRMHISPQERADYAISDLKKALADLECGPLQATVSSDTAALVEPCAGSPFYQGGSAVPPVLWRIA